MGFLKGRGRGSNSLLMGGAILIPEGGKRKSSWWLSVFFEGEEEFI